jgi:hypothetical protein
MDNYWGRTDRILREEGAPHCGYCGKKMSPRDDHGRFGCSCEGHRKERELKNPFLYALRKARESKLEKKD